MKRFTLSARQRIRSSQEFTKILKEKLRTGDPLLLVYAVPNPTGTTRFGLCVSKKFGSAVRRTEIKRLLREAFRLSQHDLPRGIDLILFPQRGNGRTAQLADYQVSLVTQARRLAKRIELRSR